MLSLLQHLLRLVIVFAPGDVGLDRVVFRLYLPHIHVDLRTQGNYPYFMNGKLILHTADLW
jgi:hypothetical protein